MSRRRLSARGGEPLEEALLQLLQAGAHSGVPAPQLAAAMAQPVATQSVATQSVATQSVGQAIEPAAPESELVAGQTVRPEAAEPEPEAAALTAAADALALGRVFLDGKRLRGDWQVERLRVLSAGQVLELAELADNTEQAPEVIEERWGVAAVYKPSGLPSEPDQRGVDSLVTRVARMLGCEVHAVSRLDAEVSGVMLVAVSDAGRKLAARWLSAGLIERRYEGLACAPPEPLAGSWRGAIGVGARGQRQVVRDEPRGAGPAGRGSGQPALTHYVTRARLSTCQATWNAPSTLGSRRGHARTTHGREARASTRAGGERRLLVPTWLDFRLETGRTHQIRVHCSAAGCPLLGDTLYAGPGAATLPGGNVLEFRRVLLHASEVTVQHRGGTWRIPTPKPESLVSAWEALGGVCP